MADFLSGGYQTTINSTITELFPALTFNNKKKLNDSDKMLNYIIGLAEKENLGSGNSFKSFVNCGDMESAYQFIEDTNLIRPNMLEEKLNNAIGIQDYLYRVARERKIQKVLGRHWKEKDMVSRIRSKKKAIQIFLKYQNYICIIRLGWM